jgi:hypothetical protein
LARNKEISTVTQLHEVFRLNVMINDDFVGFKNGLNDSTRVVVSFERLKLENEGYNCDGILNLLRFQFVSTQFYTQNSDGFLLTCGNFIAVNLLHNLRMARERSQQRALRDNGRWRRTWKAFSDATSSVRSESHFVGHQSAR